MTAWDYMYKSEFKARAELSAESELVLEVELPPTAPMNGAKIEIKIQAIGFAIVFAPLGCTQHGRIRVVVLGIPTHLATYTTCPVSCGRTPANTKLVTVRRMHLKLVFSSRNRRASTSCVVTPLLFVSCTVKGHA